MILHDNWDASWTLARVSASKVKFEASQWHQKQSNETVYIIEKYNDDDDAYKVIINSSHLLGLRYRQLQFNLRYNLTKLKERQKDVYDTLRAIKRVCALWLCHAAYKIYSEQHPEVQPAYCHFAQLNALYKALVRAIQIHDILMSLFLWALLSMLINMFHRHLLLAFKEIWHKILWSHFWLKRQIMTLLTPITIWQAMRTIYLKVFNFPYYFQYHSKGWEVMKLKWLHLLKLYWNCSMTEWTFSNMGLLKSTLFVTTLTCMLWFSTSQEKEHSRILIQRKCAMRSWSLWYSQKWQSVHKV